jgi:NAD(P)-dependent dehydrogenase (short-subunit alcohol dehydrogenase family)
LHIGFAGRPTRTGASIALHPHATRADSFSGASAIVLIDLRKEDAEHAAKELTDWFVEHGEAEAGEIQALGLGCDVASEESVREAFGKIKEKFGRIDTCVTAAGIVENYVAHEYPTDRVKKLMDINVMGTWFCALEAAKLMPEGGAITMIGSMSGAVVNVPQPQTPYNFSKAAVRHMARSLAVEWANKQIRVNCISYVSLHPTYHFTLSYLEESAFVPDMTDAPGAKLRMSSSGGQVLPRMYRR